jgi:hypothetical protein
MKTPTSNETKESEFLAYLILNLFKEMTFEPILKEQLEPCFTQKSPIKLDWFPHFIKQVHMVMINRPSEQVILKSILYLARIAPQIPRDQVFDYFLGCVQLSQFQESSQIFQVKNFTKNHILELVRICEIELEQGHHLDVYPDEYASVKHTFVKIARDYQQICQA